MSGKSKVNELFHTQKINSHLTRITGLFGEMMYLAEGTERAVLIDTGMGIGNLKDVTDSLTKKPLTILLTHGHLDHAMAAWRYEDIYMNPADEHVLRENEKWKVRKKFFEKRFPDQLELLERTHPFSYKKLYDQQRVSLGGLTVEALKVPGHTPGSMVFLLEEDGILIMGDACNSNTLVYDWYSTSIETYYKSLINLQKKLKNRGPLSLFSHEQEAQDTSRVLKEGIMLCEKIMTGEAQEIPAVFFDSPGLLARSRNGSDLSSEEAYVNIMYSKDRIFDVSR